MDDSCAVCAESLEWTAYGACGHKDVCSTCVARLRFICNDSRCCICKSSSDFVFVTKALGDYTHMITDFSTLPSQPREGRVGSYWYHEHTQAFFDDVDHYKMIKAMCRLSCSLCDKLDDLPADGPKRRPHFRNIDHLKGHLFRQHHLLMCSLCLESRKVFICEQKLYTRAQLNQHISTGDSEVDGSESERGGFSGHPKCEFCRSPFYGDNELYLHMSTEHFICHICQRQHPGQYEYYKDYDDLEIHFGRDHFLCEDEACLAKKFVVFQSEAELKRHNTLEHGGRMSRSKRNAALQLPTSFRYRRGNSQDNHRGSGRTFRRDTSENDLSMAIQASLEASNLDSGFPDISTSSTRVASASGELSDDIPLVASFDPLSTTDSELSSRYREAVSQSTRNTQLHEASFPPLPMVPGSSQSRPLQDVSLKKTMAAHLRRRNKVKVLNTSSSSQAGTVGSCAPVTPAIPPQRALPTSSSISALASSSGQIKLSIDSLHAASSLSNSALTRPALTPDSSSSDAYLKPRPEHDWPALNRSARSTSASGPSKLAAENGPWLSSFSSSLQARPAIVNESSSNFPNSSKNRGGSLRVIHSASAPNLVAGRSFDSSAADFPPVSALQIQKSHTDYKVVTAAEHIHTANKSLVEQIRVALDFDQDKYSTFKDISAEYCQGSIDAETYLEYVEQFGLSHLVLELAHLCPDVRKQKELIGTYNSNMASGENGRSGSFHLKNGNGSKKGKEKADDSRNSTVNGLKKGKEKVEAAGDSTSGDRLADSIISTVRELQSSYKPAENEIEVLSKVGYRAAKGKSKVVADQSQADLSSPDTNVKDQNVVLPGGGSSQRAGENGGRNKQRKKTSKFHRTRLGDGSAALILDLKNQNSDPDLNEAPSGGQNNPGEGLPARGVWRNGGGQKLLAMTSRGPKK